MPFKAPYPSPLSNSASTRWPHQAQQRLPIVHRHYDLNNVAVSKWNDPYESTLPQYAIGSRATGKRVIKKITADGEQSSDSEDDEGEDEQEVEEGKKTAVPAELEEHLVPSENGNPEADTTPSPAVSAAAKILNLSKEPRVNPPEPTPGTASIVVINIPATEEAGFLPEASEPPNDPLKIPESVADALVEAPLVEIYGSATDVEGIAPTSVNTTKPASGGNGKKYCGLVGTAEMKASMEQEVLVMREEDLEGDDFVIVDEGKKEKEKEKKKQKETVAVDILEDILHSVDEPSRGQASASKEVEHVVAEKDEPDSTELPPRPLLPTGLNEKPAGSSRERRSSYGTAGWTRPSRKRRDSEVSTKERPRSSQKVTYSRKDSLLEASKERAERRNHIRSNVDGVKPTEPLRKGSKKAFIIDDGREKERENHDRSADKIERTQDRPQSNDTDSRTQPRRQR